VNNIFIKEIEVESKKIMAVCNSCSKYGTCKSCSYYKANKEVIDAAEAQQDAAVQSWVRSNI